MLAGDDDGRAAVGEAVVGGEGVVQADLLSMLASAVVLVAGSQLPVPLAQSMPGLVAVGKPWLEPGAAPGGRPVSVKL